MQLNQSNTTNSSIQSCLDQMDAAATARDVEQTTNNGKGNRRSEKPYRDTEVILKTLRKALLAARPPTHTLSRSRVPSPPASLLTALINRSTPLHRCSHSHVISRSHRPSIPSPSLVLGTTTKSATLEHLNLAGARRSSGAHTPSSNLVSVNYLAPEMTTDTPYSSEAEAERQTSTNEAA